jgi:uncharacterized membrane protein
MISSEWATLARWSGRLVWISYLVLLAQQVADCWVHGAPWVIWLVKLVPLLIFLPGMLRDRLRTYLWLCFVSLGYFVGLVERIFAQPGSTLAICGLTAVVVLFCSAMMYVRWRARDLQASGDASSASEGEA